MSKFSESKLNEVASQSLYTTFTNSNTILYSLKIFSRYLREGRILELGPAEGLMTPHLLKYDSNLTVIEGSSVFAAQLKEKYPSLRVINSLFEDTKLEEKFDFIILGHVLEHVADPVSLLRLVKTWLSPAGKVLCAVPNAMSLHRQAAVEMGLLNTVFSQSEKDVHHGHMRIYEPDSFKSDFRTAGFQIDQFGGYWLKPLSDKQLEESWSQEMLSAFLKLGESYPEIAAEIYIVASL
ncbi:MAG TPA: class I SAM-dependent methyltransferase [Cyclobacteriaceae bacterium]|nr:class I SAM-dependent methyltransferase [Cyclobacteriaceae bacterium]